MFLYLTHLQIRRRFLFSGAGLDSLNLFDLTLFSNCLAYLGYFSLLKSLFTTAACLKIKTQD